ncbi:TPA: NleB family type III secretion system effector arginine glycosyltransferase [Escherichia coli]|nr:NleB family type III secretion system effector arginine glycosyltransferase [Escherichia coli]HBN2122000.1 NleB family type III secretion system effector arginine glycosyltransferase [Escherichia coli]
MLSPIRTTFHNSVNIVQSSPCQTVSFAGKEYELKVIDEKTPILFQWFEPNPGRYKKDEVPIVNTKQHPYLDNVINAAKIESDRTIGIFVDGDFSASQKAAFSKLERDFENIMIIYREDVDFSMYDRKLSDIYHDAICEQKLRAEDERDECLLNLLEKELGKISNEKDSLISMYAEKREHTWFDFFRNLALLKAGDIFRYSCNTKNHDISSGNGCIYLDMDMILTDKLGTIYAPDGISIHVDRRNDSVNIENSAIIVNRSNHPALLDGLSFMHSKADAHPYYDGFGKGLKKHFNCTPLQNYNHFCDFIEFKHPNVIMNTSQYTGSSW